MFKELSEDLESAAGQGGAFTLLKNANWAARREFAKEELEDVGKAKEGAELTSTNFAQAHNKIQKLRREDELFAKSFQKGELDAIEKTLKELSEIKLPPPPKGLNAGSLIAVTRSTGLGGAAAFAARQFGLDPVATIGGVLAGDWILKKSISTAVQSAPGRKVLLNIYRSPGGLTPAKIGALLNVTREAVNEGVRGAMGE